MKHYLLVIFALMIFGVPAVSSRFGDEADAIARLFGKGVDRFAAVIMSRNPKTVDEIRSRYPDQIIAAAPVSSEALSKVRILIVPGHEPDYGGAEYRDLKERDIAVELSSYLKRLFDGDSHFNAFVTRDDQGWSNDFSAYFKDQWQSIIEWQKTSAQDTARRISSGQASKPVKLVYHNRTSNDVAYRLYGINKWADEHDIDITIHVHFNDEPTRPANGPGTYSGFTIYIPERQYANSTTSREVASSVFKRLSKYNPVSDLKGESAGIVEDPDLIAIGAHNTSDGATLLIEYGYIYEKQFSNKETRTLALKDLAYQTYLGIEDFFDSEKASRLSRAYDTLVLPHSWKRILSKSAGQNGDIFALQTAFIKDGVYPPKGNRLSDCPRSGSFGSCTEQALSDFQKRNGISDEKGITGPKTLQILNRAYGL